MYGSPRYGPWQDGYFPIAIGDLVGQRGPSYPVVGLFDGPRCPARRDLGNGLISAPRCLAVAVGVGETPGRPCPQMISPMINRENIQWRLRNSGDLDFDMVRH